jgi:hypothetical protein
MRRKRYAMNKPKPTTGEWRRKRFRSSIRTEPIGRKKRFMVLKDND